MGIQRYGTPAPFTRLLSHGQGEGASSQSSASQDTFDNTFPHRVVDALGLVKLTLQMIYLCLQGPYSRLQFYSIIWSLASGIRRRQAFVKYAWSAKTCYSRMRKRPEGPRQSRSGWNQTTGETSQIFVEGTLEPLSVCLSAPWCVRMVGLVEPGWPPLYLLQIKRQIEYDRQDQEALGTLSTL
jgi:hypothetical protein